MQYLFNQAVFLLFNPKEPHCKSSRSNTEDDVYSISCYLKTRVVGLNDNSNLSIEFIILITTYPMLPSPLLLVKKQRPKPRAAENKKANSPTERRCVPLSPTTSIVIEIPSPHPSRRSAAGPQSSSLLFLMSIYSLPTVKMFVLVRSRVDADDTMVNDVDEIHFAILSY